MNELYEATNPIFNTAKMTLNLLTSVGNTDAAEFSKVLGFEKQPHVEGQSAEIELLGKIGAVTIELRYALANRMIEQAGNKNVLDLACGYTPKAKYLMDKGYNYVGGDLPAVAEDMTRVSRELLDSKAKFCVVDVTNGASIEKAAEGFAGPITVDCEGLMSYLDKNEITAAVNNIASLLRKHGGCWVTTDFESDSYFFVIAQAVSGGAGSRFSEIVQSQVINKTADAAHAPVFKSLDEKAEFLESLGLSVERRPITGLETLGLRTLYALTVEQRAAITAALEKVNVWIMTPKTAAETYTTVNDGGLGIGERLDGEKLTVALTGRLDSISAPELLGRFREIISNNTVGKITLDLTNLEYTSSAGLRVMLMMYKHVGQGNMTLLGVNDTVADVLKTTGFSEFF